MSLDDAPNSAFEFANREWTLQFRLSPISELSSVIARRIGSLKWVLCASPRYIEVNGQPTSPSDLANHNCLVHVKLAPDRIWRFKPDRSVKVTGSFTCNSDLVIRQAALAGIGVAELPIYYIREDLDAGTLVQIQGPF